MSKTRQFIRDFLNNEGKSGLIVRYTLPDYCAYTSGDGIFRNDGQLGKKYKFCRFSQRFDPDRKTSRAWDLTDEDRVMLLEEQSQMTFPRGGRQVYYIKFYGLGVQRRAATIRGSIKREICKLPCVSCGTTTGIECDHKNDLVLEQNDERVLNTQTQTLSDFQPLCKHCNDVKRAVKAKMMREKKRQGAPGFPSCLAFTEGDETLDMTKFDWYKGTYWGDVAAFKREITRKIFGDNIVQEAVEAVEAVEEAEQVANAIQMAIIANHYELNIGAATDEELIHSLGSYTIDNKPSNKKI